MNRIHQKQPSEKRRWDSADVQPNTVFHHYDSNSNTCPYITMGITKQMTRKDVAYHHQYCETAMHL